jgi:O-6-methylguanine DNA methyltransferase
MKSFSDKVRDIVRKIPKGKTMTYKEVAARAGNPKAARAVGTVMRTNYDPSIPCHRVIASDGSMGGYNRSGVERKREILFEEKVSVSENSYTSSPTISMPRRRIRRILSPR